MMARMMTAMAIACLCGAMSCDTSAPSEPMAPSDPADSCTPKTVKPDTCEYENIAILSPLGCQHLLLGDTLHVQWRYYQAARNLFMVDVELSLDNGETFAAITPGHSIGVQGPDGAYDWVIPDTTACVADSAIVRVSDYGNPGESDQSHPFSVRRPQGAQRKSGGSDLRVLSRPDGHAHVFALRE
jgi:hypothetical protein